MGKRGKTSLFASIVTALLAICGLLIVSFSFLPYRQGSFLYAVLSPLNAFADGYVNVFVSESLRTYGLFPLLSVLLLNFVLCLCGSGLVASFFRLALYCGLDLIGIYVQEGSSVFLILNVLPEYYHFIGLGLVLASIIALSVIGKVKSKKKEKKVEPVQTQIPTELESPVEEVQSTEASEPEVEEEPYERDPLLSRRALSALEDVKVPEFNSFQNYSVGAAVSSVDRSIYETAEREAQILREEQEKRRLLEEQRARNKAIEEERARREAEENRKRLENMFKPRTLLRRLNEDAQAEKSFPSFSEQNLDMDYSISKSPEPARAQVENTVQFQSVSVENASVSAPVRFAQQTGPVSFSVPVSQQSPNIGAMEAQQPAIAEISVEEPDMQTALFKKAQEEAEKEEELAMRRRQAELQKKYLEQMQELERKRREAEEETSRVEAELQRAREELEAKRLEAQRIQEEQLKKEAERKEQEEKAALAAAAKPAISPSKAVEVQSQAEADPDEEFEEQKRSVKQKGPDVDFVSGVAGTKNASLGNSYLIDKQKFVYEFPPQSLLRHYPISSRVYEDIDNDPDGITIVETLKQFRIDTKVIGIQHGPTFTLYELSLQKGIKVTSVLGLAENLAMELSVEAVRILAPIPGKPAIGIEVPNKTRDTIGFDVMMAELTSKNRKIPMVLGKTITGDSIVIDVAKTPHLLVAGTTGSGKSVCINGLICSVLFTKTPKDVRMILVDPKRVELSLYNGIPHLLTPVIVEPKKALKAMQFVVEEMERRMALFTDVGAKKIEDYNEKIEEQKLCRVKLPYIMVIIDEFADLMLAVGKELEGCIKRISAVARFCGIHLVLATQRPSSDVITGVIKSNIPTQIAFAVSNALNSRIIIDSSGAEMLLGRGDMLFNNPESRTPTRIQGAYIDSEIEEIVRFVKKQGEPDYIDESYFEDDDDSESEEGEEESGAASPGEDMFNRAWKIVSERGEASASYLQRRLGIGYNRAANLIEQMEDAGYIGPPRGSKRREILKLYGSD